MKKCPYCGSTKGYYMIERVHRSLQFTFDDKPDGATEDVGDYFGKRKYCRYCERILPREREAVQNEQINRCG